MKRTATCSYTPEHTCISWSYVVRLLLPCPAKPSHWERGGGERARASPVGFKRASASASISAPKYTSNQPYHDNTSCATLTPPNPQHIHTSHNGTRHLLGRAPPVHQLGCAPQARHPLEFGHWQLRPSDCGMLGLGDETLEHITLGCHAEQKLLHRPLSLRSANASATTTDCKSLSHTLVSAIAPGHWTTMGEKEENIWL
jgi:hypothetical protein